MRDAFFALPAASWIPSPPPVPAQEPLGVPELFSLNQADDEEFAIQDPYDAVGSPGRDPTSTPRRWLNSAVGGTDAMLQSPFAFVLSLSLMILTPVVASVL